jgi:hypothetical protein
VPASLPAKVSETDAFGGTEARDTDQFYGFKFAQYFTKQLTSLVRSGNLHKTDFAHFFTDFRPLRTLEENRR